MSDNQSPHERTDGHTKTIRIGAVLVLLILLAGCTLAPPVEYDRDPELSMDSTNYLAHGDTFNVTVENHYQQNGENETTDVTDQATITSGDTDGIEVVDGNTLQATTNESYNDRVVITAEYSGYETNIIVAVAQTEVSHLETLSPEYRIAAMMGDVTVSVIVVSIMSGIIASRWASAFAGLGAMEMTLLVGWFAGWVPLGIALVGLFTAMFIGFNLAANIDYTVRR